MPQFEALSSLKSYRWSDLSRAGLAALYFFLIMCTYYMLKPLRDASFLSEFPASAKPLFNLVTMVILFFAAAGYTAVIKRVSGRRVLHLFFVFVIAHLLIFRVLIESHPQLTGALFYTWLACANVFLVMIFWTQVNSTFTARRDRLLYVIIGLGGGLGAAFGGEITQNLVPYIGPNNLIFAAIIGLALAHTCASRIIATSSQEPFNVPEHQKSLVGFNGILRDRYALCLLALVVIGTFVQTIYDYQLTYLVESEIGKDKVDLAVFYGGLYSRLNTFSFLAQILVGPVVLLSIGPARGMYGLLALIAGTSVVLVFDSSLPVMEWVFIVFAGSGYSVIQMFREQLYLPASDGVKVGSKGFIDTFGYRAGDAFAAVSFAVLIGLFGADFVRLDYLVMGAGVLAGFIVFEMNRIYRRMETQSALSNNGVGSLTAEGISVSTSLAASPVTSRGS